MLRTTRDLPVPRPQPPRWRRCLSVWAPFGVVVAIAGLEFALPANRSVIALLVAVPALAALDQPSSRRFLLLGCFTSAVAAGLGVTQWQQRPGVVSTTLVGIAVVAAIGWRTAKFFERQSRSIEQQSKAVADLRAIADAVQDVVMQPVPRRIGPLRAEVRYLAAAAEASVGGDFYSVLRTPFGVRVLIGDVVGHGLPAVQTSADILRAYRDLAQHEAKLAGLALRLNMAVAQRDDGRTFVTALLLSVPDDGPASLISCGHPPPLLLRGDSVTVVDLPPPALPLGLLHLGAGWCPTSPVTFGPGDRLLLYTDGVTEARDAAGQFYPLADRVAALRRDDPAAFLDALQADLLRHVNARPHAADARLDDDAAMLLLQRDPSAADAVRALDHPLRRAVRDLP